jgi:23S rRNA pseudouridine955/2504/2580 synthase
MEQELSAGADDDGRRLDRILRRAFPDLPLSMIHRLLRTGRVTVDGRRADAARRVAQGARIRVRDAPLRAAAAGTGEAAAPAPPLDVLWEGGGLLLVNKRAGLAVHAVDGRGAAADRRPPCLDALVREYLRGTREPSLSFRPGPLHRLDQVSSGVIAFSTSLAGARAFTALMREGRLRKTYLALADGLVAAPAAWEDTLLRDKTLRKTRVLPEKGEGADAARPGRSRVFPLAARADFSLIAVEIETGRTHQIRSQAAFHGHPLAGDRKYGGSFRRGGPLLHAFSLAFPPEHGPEELRGKTVRAPLPGPFLARIRELFGEAPAGGYLHVPPR